MIISIDFDDVVIDYISVMLNFFNKKYNNNIRLGYIHSHNFWKAWINSTFEEVRKYIEEFAHSHGFEEIPIIFRTREGILEMKAKGNFSLILTSRSKLIETRTEGHCARILSGILIFYSRNGKTKAQMYREFKVYVHIKDCVEYIVGCANVGVYVVFLQNYGIKILMEKDMEFKEYTTGRRF